MVEPLLLNEVKPSPPIKTRLCLSKELGTKNRIQYCKIIAIKIEENSDKSNSVIFKHNLNEGCLS